MLAERAAWLMRTGYGGQKTEDGGGHKSQISNPKAQSTKAKARSPKPKVQSARDPIQIPSAFIVHPSAFSNNLFPALRLPREHVFRVDIGVEQGLRNPLHTRALRALDEDHIAGLGLIDVALP